MCSAKTRLKTFSEEKMLNYIVKFTRALNSNSKPEQIANAFCIGILLGFMPKNNLLWYLLFVFFLFVRFNKSGYFIMLIIGSLIAPLCDGIFDTVGYAALTFKPLENFYSALLDVPFVGFTRFNNSVVCGSLLCGLIVYIPLFILTLFGIKAWRKYIAPSFNNSKIFKLFYQIPLVGKIASKISG